MLAASPSTFTSFAQGMTADDLNTAGRVGTTGPIDDVGSLTRYELGDEPGLLSYSHIAVAYKLHQRTHARRRCITGPCRTGGGPTPFSRRSGRVARRLLQRA